MPTQYGSRRPCGRFAACIFFAACLAVVGGCSFFQRPAVWKNGECRYAERLRTPDVLPCVQTSVRRYEESDRPAVDALAAQAAAREAACDPTCVDLYFVATCRAWQHVETLGANPTQDDLIHESQKYQACLAKLLATAQRFGRIDPRGLHVVAHEKPLRVPLTLHGFAWTAEDFNAIEVVGENRLGKHTKAVRTEGVGVPLVVLRHRPEDEEFHRRVQPFAATAVLRTRLVVDVAEPKVDGAAESDVAVPDVAAATAASHVAHEELVLEFYNPASNTHLIGKNTRWKLAGDQTAPLAWTVSKAPNDPIAAFLRPDGERDRPQLVMLEPYQPGKIPIVFVHGLLSDPTTWVTLGNALRAEPWFTERYQVWTFRYPSGIPFLVSAAVLRRELNAAIDLSPGAADDPAARQMVLIGHSMGGLVSKLQVTESGTDLWDLVADRPLDAIIAEPADRDQLREVFFFKPVPYVRKVVFIGTPHGGSSLASRGVGRVSSWIARSPTEADARHRRVVADNPGVFSPWISRRIPTSVDLLEPGHPLLVAMQRMSVAPGVQLHSIIGVADLKPLAGPGDHVVSLESASICRVHSEKLVSETHEDLHEAATTQIEVQRILKRQLMMFHTTEVVSEVAE